MKTHFLFMFLLMISSSIKAQVLPVVTPSPEAAALGSVAKLPVDYHTGQVNIEIPLLEVEQGGFKLPIKLTYNTTGIQINNRTTWVGTNWNLDAGGVITRTVKGNADENGESGFWKKGEKLNDPQWYNNSYLVDNVYNGPTEIISLEPDEFNFKAPGISGTFYVGNDKKPYIVEQPDMKVEMSSQLSHAGGDSNYHPAWMYIKITDPNGVQYQFQTVETSASINQRTGLYEGFDSSWLLSFIIIPQSNDIIYFNYSKEYNDEGVSFQEIYSTNCFKWNENGFWGTSSGSYSFFSGEKRSTIGHRYLASVEGNNFKIDFTRSEQSKNVLDPKWSQLKAITLLRKSDNKQMKKIQFQYDKEDADKRFWLNSIHVFGQNETESFPPYQFEYYPYNDLPVKYLNYHYADHWGYYKGTYGKLIPDIINDMSDLYYSPERNSKPDQLIKGMLQQITYPTGGYIKLVYEPNDFSVYGETRKGTDIIIRNVKKIINDSSQLINSKKDTGGGLRIKELSYWSDNKRAATYRYKYITNYNPQNSYNDDKTIISSGILGSVPIYHYSIDPNKIDIVTLGYAKVAYETDASQSFSEESLSHGAIVGYSEVTESIYDTQNRVSGYIKYKYSNFDTSPDLPAIVLSTMVNVCFTARINRSMDRGLLLSKEVYDKNYSLKKKFNYSYSNDHPNNIRAVQAVNAANIGSTAMFATAAYLVPLDTPILTEETEITYENNAPNGLKKTTQYTYNSKKQTREIKSLMNDGKTWYRKSFYYPSDYETNPVYKEMIDKNMIAPIVLSEELMTNSDKQNTGISKEKYNYRISNGIPVISNYQSSKGTATVKTHVTYDYYDKKGNPIHITIDDKEEITYLWGYNYQYIVAEIKNASMDEVMGIIGDIDKFEEANTPDASKLYQLRTQLKNALIRTFTFDPLVGKVSETNAKGVSTYFEYDQLNRLKYTRDYLGNIMDGYLYNYSNTNQ